MNGRRLTRRIGVGLKRWKGAQLIELDRWSSVKCKVQSHVAAGGRGIVIRCNFLNQHKGSLLVKLKAIKSREDIFCYLSSYLHRSFLYHLVIVTSNHSIKSSGQCGDLYWCCCAIGLSAGHWVIEALSYCRDVSYIELLSCNQLCAMNRLQVLGPLLLPSCLSKLESVSMRNLILLEYFIDNGCLHLSSNQFLL